MPHSTAETIEDVVFEIGLAGYIFNMNRPAGQTTEVTRALWFRISPRPMFFVCRQVFQCFTLVGVCMCMSAWINERLTEWLFFFRLKTNILIKKNWGMELIRTGNSQISNPTCYPIGYAGCWVEDRAGAICVRRRGWPDLARRAWRAEVLPRCVQGRIGFDFRDMEPAF